MDLGVVEAAIVAVVKTLGPTRLATTDRRRFGPLASALSLETPSLTG